MMPALFALYSLSKSLKDKIKWRPCLLMLTQRGVFLHRTQIERKCSTVDVTRGGQRSEVSLIFRGKSEEIKGY